MNNSEPKNPSFNFVRKLFRFLDPFLVISILFSVALSLYLFYIQVDKVDSVLVGLMATTISLVIDLIARLKGSEKKITQAIGIVDLLTQNDQLSDKIYALVSNYLAAKQGWFDMFASRADDALTD